MDLQKDWIVFCPKEHYVVDTYSTQADAVEAARSFASGSSGDKSYLVYELVAGFSPVNEATPIQIQ